MFGLTPYDRRNGVSVYNPFKELDDFEKKFFGNGGVTEFRTDIRDNEKEFVLEADLPGFSKDDIKIDCSDGYLTISAERKNENDEKDDKGNYIRRERSFGSFSRSFDITSIAEDSIKASFDNGVLKVILPKIQETAPKTHRIEIE